MTSRERVLEREKQRGKAEAETLQAKSAEMNGTQLYAADDRIPNFSSAMAKMNMIDRIAGFVCKSTAGRVVRLIQPYDSNIYSQEPEKLPAQWGFVWSTDPQKALPFIALSTSPYNKGECCIDGDNTFRSKIDNNVWRPSEYPQGWEVV